MLSSTLIRTKLNIPQIDDAVIPRQQLLTRLDSGLYKRLTLIAAPTGYGKTTLAVSWLRKLAAPTAWFSIGAMENDFSLFCHYLVAAIHKAQPDAAANTLEILRASQPPTARLFEASLINDLSVLNNRSANDRTPALIIALDDYHLVHAPAIHALMHNLILHLSGQIHILLISRQDPLLLPISRLRGQNDVNEIRQRDLRFTPVETRKSLSRMLHADVSEEFASDLAQRVEGWPTGIRLTSLALANNEQPADFLTRSGLADGYITEFLVDEVVARQSPERHRFLLETSILDRLCDDLCAAVVTSDLANLEEKNPVENHSLLTNEPLATLARSDLFLIALDVDHDWYRYHHFFQEMLFQRLQNSATPEQIALLHQRAARWYANAGLIEESIDHFILAGDDESAAELIAEHSKNPLNAIERSTQERWLARLPTAWHHPRLLIAQLWLLYRQWRLSALEQALDRLAEPEASPDIPLKIEPIRGHLAMLRATVLLFYRSNANEAAKSADRALSDLPPSAADARAVGTALSVLARQHLGIETKTLIVALHEALNDITANRPSRQQILLGLALFHRTAADMHAMDNVVAQFRSTNSPTGALSSGAGWLGGMVHYEWDDLDKAETYFNCASAQRESTNFAAAFNSILGLARIALARGIVTEAAEHLEDARTAAYALNNLDMMSVAMAINAEIAQKNGTIEEALRWARSFVPGSIVEPVIWLDAPSIVWGRILAAHGRHDERENALHYFEEQLRPIALRHFIQRRVQMLICCAQLCISLGRQQEAERWLRQSVALAMPGTLIRSFVDGGSSLLAPLSALRSTGLEPAYLDRILTAFETDRPTEPSVNRVENSLSAASSTGIPVKLTRREVEILGLIQSGKTNAEIAERLVISVHTVKRHGTNIYRKLDVRNRTEAIRVAQASGILPSADSHTQPTT